MRQLLGLRWPWCFLLCVLALAALPLRAQQGQAAPNFSDAPELLTVQWCATAAKKLM